MFRNPPTSNGVRYVEVRYSTRRLVVARTLSQSAFVVLLALADRPRHGLGIVEDTEARTGGRVKLGPGSLYGTLRRLEELEYVRELAEAPEAYPDDPRRNYYEMTEEGRRALAEEAERVRALVDMAWAKDVLQGGG
jgi:DNA-binding PadR family transcriptional regulator